jgi:peptidoglycan/LPS O-acetylase OafA/YrhL
METEAASADSAASVAAGAVPASAARSTSEILPLTSLRFAAALWVFVFHVNLHWPLGLPAPLDRIVIHGPVGMSLFFVLSGFVLAYSYGRGDELPVRRYAWHRFARIYPVYTLAALVTLPFLLPPDRAVSAAQVAFVIAAHLLMLQAWFPQLMPFWNFGASWSLSVEAFFYALFPALLALCKTLGRRGWLVFLAVAYAGAVLPGLSYLLFPGTPPIFYAMPIFRLGEFALGLACGVWFLRGGRLPAPRVVAAASTLVLVLFVGYMPRADIYVTLNAVVVPCIALVILALAQLRTGVLAASPLVVLV